MKTLESSGAAAMQVPPIHQKPAMPAKKAAQKDTLNLNRSTTPTKPDSISIRCSICGVVSVMQVGGLPASLNLDYVHPLAYYSNTQKIASLPLNVLANLAPEILAGIVLTQYQHFGLIEVHQDAFVSNSILRTAGVKNLLAAVQLSACFSKHNTKHLAHFSLDYETHKHFNSIGDAFGNRIKEWRQAVYLGDTRDDVQKALERNLEARSKGKIPSSTLSDYDRQFEENLIAWRKELKQLINVLGTGLQAKGFGKVYNYLKLVAVARNLVAINGDTRQKLIGRLQEALLALGSEYAPSINKVILIIQETDNPYDIFAKVEDALERASDSFERPKPKTLAEILAAKKEAEALVAYAETNLVSGSASSSLDSSILYEVDAGDSEDANEDAGSDSLFDESTNDDNPYNDLFDSISDSSGE